MGFKIICKSQISIKLCISTWSDMADIYLIGMCFGQNKSVSFSDRI